MKIAILGNTEITKSIVSALTDAGVTPFAIISKPVDFRAVNSIDLKQDAEFLGCEYREFKTLESDEALSYLQFAAFDYIVSNWPDLLSYRVISCANFFVIGSHPTDLPRNRGRHPLHWMIVLGINKSSVTLFQMNEKPDDGPILLRTPYTLPKGCNIRTALKIVAECYYEATKELFCKLKNKELKPNPQIGECNTWRKRTRHDSIIDPRMAADLIVKTVDSMSEPFPGAEIIIANKNYTAIIARELLDYEKKLDLEYGSVLRVAGKTIYFTTPTNPVAITVSRCIENPEVRYILPPTYFYTKN
jgi:methionyl-tRNA formyltransferase